MLLTEIKHEAITLPIESSDEIGNLAAEAATVLGYRVLKDTVETPSAMPPLLKVLGELGIEVLNKQDVQLYMRDRLRERTEQRLKEWDAEPIHSWGGSNYFMGPSWEATEISKYKEPIPEFVVNKAVQIKRALPEVKVWIRHLTEDRDPFLEVTLGKADDYNADSNGSERYFVEVWEEPKFEGRLR